jgi:hypothetical protein
MASRITCTSCYSPTERYAITKEQGLNLNQLLRERFRLGKPEQLSLREASRLIDDLKGTSQERG